MPDEIFEVGDTNLAGRTGRITTKSGKIDTPALLPVLDARRQLVSPSLIEQMGFQAVITNAYLMLKRKVNSENAHEYLGFDKVVMTDSGAYQLLEFGEIDVTQEEVIEFQERINTDIGVILDHPTGATQNYHEVAQGVNNTLINAKKFVQRTSPKKDILWVGPVQGGIYTELIKQCSLEMSKMPFHIHALGSPTQFLEGYKYSQIIGMLAVAKRYLPPSRPLHLFGAGHPASLSLFVAMGADLFDSASYALFAKAGRYLTQSRTYRLNDLTEFPCVCAVCSRYTPRELNQLSERARQALVAEHNLWVILQEMKTIRQAIRYGTLWDLISTRAAAHPSLHEAMRSLKTQRKLLIKNHAIHGVTKSGVLSHGSSRPEFLNFRVRTLKYMARKKIDSIVIIPYKAKKTIQEHEIENATATSKAYPVIIHPELGIVPAAFYSLYPVFQTETSRTTFSNRMFIKSVKDLGLRHIYFYRRSGQYEALRKKLGSTVKLLDVP